MSGGSGGLGGHHADQADHGPSPCWFSPRTLARHLLESGMVTRVLVLVVSTVVTQPGWPCTSRRYWSTGPPLVGAVHQATSSTGSRVFSCGSVCTGGADVHPGTIIPLTSNKPAAFATMALRHLLPRLIDQLQ
jgi:hypothetical protein